MANVTSQVKVYSANKTVLERACELFLGKSELEICRIIKETVEGHQGTVLGDMTVEEILKDRKKFSRTVLEVVSADLINMGLQVVSYMINVISDDLHYLKSLGMTRTAQVKRDARIGEAEAEMEAQVKEAEAERQLQESKYACERDIAKFCRDFELRKMTAAIEVETRMAQADFAYQLQEAKMRQRIKEEEIEVKIIEREQQGRVQQEEEIRKERELEALVRKPAEAERFRLETMAQAHRVKTTLEALAEAEAIKMIGEAEAYVIEARGVAEAKHLTEMAEAWKDYQKAAMVDMILEALLKVAAEVSAPLTNVRKVTMVSGAHEIGALKLTSELMDIIERVILYVEDVTNSGYLKKVRITL